MRKFGALTLSTVALGACALKGDVRRVELEVAELREETARADSARAVELSRQVDAILAGQRAVMDSIIVVRRNMAALAGAFRSDHTEIQRQLIQVQELTGQSQRRLTELRVQIQSRAALRAQPGVVEGDNGAVVGPLAGQADELYEAALQQLRRGSAVTARTGFQMFIDRYSNHPRTADARFLLGEAWSQANADSAAAAYEAVVTDFPDSPRASLSLFKLGVIAQQDDRLDDARTFYRRVLAGYPGSDEAALAQDRLRSLQR